MVLCCEGGRGLVGTVVQSRPDLDAKLLKHSAPFTLCVTLIGRERECSIDDRQRVRGPVIRIVRCEDHSSQVTCEERV